MDSTSHLQVSIMENPLKFDWLCHEEEDPIDKVLEVPPSDHDSIFEFCNFGSLPFPHQDIHFDEFKDFADISSDMFSVDYNLVPSMHEEDYMVIDVKPLMMNATSEFSSTEVSTMMPGQFGVAGGSSLNSNYEVNQRKVSNKSKQRGVAVLELEEIQRHFHVPITTAAKELKVGLTVLKKRCRELNIMRWPHRKIKSLKSLINNVKELGLTNEIVMLEEHTRLLEQLPDMDLSERTKKLRQACFKAKYKKKRALDFAANP